MNVDTQNRLLGAPYQYDAAGDLANDGNHTYTYDAEGRVTQVDGGATATYVYDGLGNRVEKTVGGSDSQYVYDNAGRLNTRFGNGAYERSYVYLGSQQLAEYFQNTTYFVHGDNLGSTRLLTRVDKSVCESDDYYPYGEAITSGTCDLLKFTGKERDSESGLDNFGARYFTSSMGRFMTPDWDLRPVAVPYAKFGDPQTLNLYTYVENGPVDRLDADGHQERGSAAPDAACKGGPTSGCTGVPLSQEKAQDKPAVSLTVEGGFGLEYKGGIKGAKNLEGKVGGAVKGELEVSSEGVKVSAKGEVEGHVGPVKFGGVEAGQVTRNEHGESEKPTITYSRPGIEAGKSEITGWKNEITIGASVYEGPGAGVSVTIRPTEVIKALTSGATCGCDFNTNQHGIGAWQ